MNKTFDTIIETVRKGLNEEAKNHNLFVLVREVLAAKWEGKKLNKRVRDQVAAKLPATAVVYYDGNSIGIWGDDIGIRFENRFTVYLREVIFTLKDFDHANQCVGSAAKERNNVRTVDLTAIGKLQRFAAAIDALKAAQAEYDTLREDITDAYAIERALGLRK